MLLLVDFGEFIIFVILFLASIVAGAVVLERVILMKKNAGGDAGRFIARFTDLVAQKDLKAATDLAQNSPSTVYARFARFSLGHYLRGAGRLAELMEGKIIEERLFLEKRLSILNTLGNNAPFIGLLGTVLGVIKAFHGLGTLGNTGAEVVMRSISSALLATAAGLFVAIPVVMSNNYLARKLRIIIQNLEILARNITAISPCEAAGTGEDKGEYHGIRNAG
jgi:biopolymer transport protein ExbB